MLSNYTKLLQKQNKQFDPVQFDISYLSDLIFLSRDKKETYPSSSVIGVGVNHVNSPRSSASAVVYNNEKYTLNLSNRKDEISKEIREMETNI